MLAIKGQPTRDSSDIQSICYRCGSTSPLLNLEGDKCSHCHHPYIRSFINFEVLPLVEFVPSSRISEEEALELIRLPPNQTAGEEEKVGDASSVRNGV